ncbi:Alpha/Beta hydrolase protein [Crucibulum laeve]|uniref:Alpha/Beta hydrolase protein n=1 Tax=Crucibulum laeve TaxID=68775 RepID=A0A5C3M0E7_9AGAR|nr:Alpha/Beta hydrolase protein [Crucibulum laeve]
MSSELIGYAPFTLGKETYQTWYKILGDVKSHRPVVTIHGGPGMSHHYMLPHTELFTQSGIPVVFYDQIGNGQSSHVRDGPKDFWTPELFMDELNNLLKHLEIYDDFDLLGQSWGGMLAGQYAATHTPPGLKRLIIANSPASVPLLSGGTDELLSKFSKEFVEMVRKHEELGTTESQEYQEATMLFYKKHTCTLDPWPETLIESFAVMDKNPTVYRTMIGPSEFSCTGSLKEWSIVDILHKVPYPTLLISAPLDQVQEASVLPFFTNIPRVKWVELQNSTHLAMYEEPERYFKVILDFLGGTKV